MKSFTIPQDIKLRDRLSGQEGDSVAFRTFSIGRWANDSDAADSVVKLNRWLKVVDRLDAAKPGDFVVLEDDDYKTLARAVEKDRKTMFAQPLLLAQLSPFFDTVIEAKDYDGVADLAKP